MLRLLLRGGLVCEHHRLPCGRLRSAGLSRSGICVTQTWRVPSPQGCVLESGDLGGSLGWSPSPAVIAGHCTRAPGEGTGIFLGTISHQPLRRVRPSSEAKGPVQEKQQTVPAEWSPAPCFTTCFPSGASSWHRTKSGWFPHGSSGLGGSCFLWTGGRAHSHLAEA